MNLKKLILIDKNTISQWLFEAIVESARKSNPGCEFRIADKPTEEEENHTMGVNDERKTYYSFMATAVFRNTDTGEIYVKEIVAYTDEYYEYYCKNFKPRTKMRLMKFLIEAVQYYKIKKKMKEMMKRSFLHEYRHVEQFNYILTHGLNIFDFIAEGKKTKYEDLILEKDADMYSDGIRIPIETLFATMEMKKK